MAEAKWQKNHKQITEFEEKKNKLLSEIEVLENERKELIATITGLRKEVKVHGGDYDEITTERIKVVNELDEKFVSLKLENEKETEERLNLSKTLTGLQNSIEQTEKKIENREAMKVKLKEEITNLNSALDELKLEKQNEENEKRKTLKELRTEISALREEKRKINAETAREKEEVLKENRLLAIKRSDLEIYETRMRKKYPSETFIL